MPEKNSSNKNEGQKRTKNCLSDKKSPLNVLNATFISFAKLALKTTKKIKPQRP